MQDDLDCFKISIEVIHCTNKSLQGINIPIETLIKKFLLEFFFLRCSWFNIWKVWVSRSLLNQSVFLQHSSRNIYSKKQEIGDFGISIPLALVKFHRCDFQPISQLLWDFPAIKWNLEYFIPKKPEKSDFEKFKIYILGQSKKNTDLNSLSIYSIKNQFCQFDKEK